MAFASHCGLSLILDTVCYDPYMMDVDGLEKKPDTLKGRFADRLFAPPPDRLATLHAKDRFARLCHSLSLPIPDTTLVTDQAALDRLGLPSALTRQRANGLNSMVGRIREAALAAA